MERRNLYAHLYVFDSRGEAAVRSDVARALNCTFHDENAKSDEFRTTWFADAMGFEIVFGGMSSQGNGRWYSINLGPSTDVLDPEAETTNIDSHLAQLLRAAGFETIVEPAEYRARRSA